MIQEYQLRVLPEIAANEQRIKEYLIQEKGLNARDITATRILKRSIDARQRTIFVNLTVRTYLNEMPKEKEYQETVYHNVSDKPQVIVVGAGPGGLFAALRLIELGLRPVIVERGKNVRIRREGSDLSIITYGNTTHLCLNVAERLEKEGGWNVEVIDIRSLIPLDRETIYESVKKTGKALVVHEDKVFGGFGGEIAAGIGSDMFRYLDAPVQRVGSTFTPVGFHPVLERAILPDADRIYDAAKKLLEF